MIDKFELILIKIINYRLKLLKKKNIKKNKTSNY